MKNILPPGVGAEAFASALDEFRKIVGKEWVFADEDSLYTYQDWYALADVEDNAASAVVAPENVEQVQAILRAANVYKTPLWPISTGKNFAYGGPAPRLKGTIILDLKRMNRILEVNEELGYALVEPGVSYFDLYNYIQERKLKLWVDVPAPGWGSVMGNALERGAGYTPYADHWGQQCGLEVVLPDGDVVRTGMGALPDSDTWQLYKYGYGPYIDGMFSQSSLGVVTKMGIWLMKDPGGFGTYWLKFPEEDSLKEIVEATFKAGIPGGIISSGAFEAANRTTRSQYYTGRDAMPESVLQDMLADLGVGRWNVHGSLYGTDEQRKQQWEWIRGAYSAVPGMTFELHDGLDVHNLPTGRQKTSAGVPNMSEFATLNWRPNGAHIAIAPMSPLSGESALSQYKRVKALSDEYGFDYVGACVITPRAMIHAVTLYFDRTDTEEKQRGHVLFNQLIEEMAAMGYGEYRTHLTFMDQVAETYSWNDHALWRLHERIKDALDPNGILAPGKQGVWPKRYRKQRV